MTWITGPQKESHRMNRRDLLACLAAGTVLPQLSACQLLGLEWRYRYRLTGEVQCGKRVYRGSSVIEIIRSKGFTGIGGEVRGEAVAIDIPGTKTLFLLLRDNQDGSPDWPIWMPHDVFSPLIGGRDVVNPDLLDHLVRLPVGTTVVLPRDLYPTLVCFGDPLNPKTVEEVNPNELSGNIGEDCTLRKVTVEITNHKVTEGLDRKLPWLNRIGVSNLDPHFKPTTSPTLAQKLTFLHFKRGV